MAFCGGGGGQTQPQTSSTVTTQELSAEQKEILGLAMPHLREAAGTDFQLFPKSVIAPRDPLEQEAQATAVDVARNQLPGVIQSPTQGLQFLSSGEALRPETNPALAQTEDAAIRRLGEAFTGQVVPSIRREGRREGGQFGGGSREDLNVRLAGRDFLNAAGDTSAQIRNEAFQNAMDNMTRSLAFAPPIINAQLAPANVLSAVGGSNRAFDQAQLSEEAQRFAAEQTLPLVIGQQLAGTALGLPGGSAISNSISSGGVAPRTSPLQSGLSGAAGGAALGSFFPGGTAIGAGLGALGGFLFG